MMPSVNYIVQICLDKDRPSGLVLQPKWVKWRLNFLKQFTLQSLYNQAFLDFKIYVVCGRRHQAITKAFWEKSNLPKVVPVYPVGDGPIGETFMWSHNFPDRQPKLEIKECAELNDSDWICIVRLDSDDLMHKNAIALIKDKTEKILEGGFNGNRADMVFQQYLYWDTVNRYIRPHKPKASTPFHVHVIPKRIYKHWPIFRDHHFIHHRYAVKNPLFLPIDYICVTDHHQKISRIRKGRKHQVMLNCTKRNLLRRTPEATGNRRQMIQILDPFGVNPDYIVGGF